MKYRMIITIQLAIVFLMIAMFVAGCTILPWLRLPSTIVVIIVISSSMLLPGWLTEQLFNACAKPLELGKQFELIGRMQYGDSAFLLVTYERHGKRIENIVCKLPTASVQCMSEGIAHMPRKCTSWVNMKGDLCIEDV